MPEMRTVLIAQEFQLAERILHTLLAADDKDWDTIVGRSYDLAEKFLKVGVARGHATFMGPEKPTT